jgi:hypothetical protein
MPDTTSARRACRRLAYLLGPAMLLGSLAIGGAAQAAVGTARPAVQAPGATPCSFQPAKTSVKPPWHDPSGGTIFSKQFSRDCRDLNLYTVGVTDNYMGWMQVKGKWMSCGKWVHLTRGTLRLTPLCTAVPAGTRMQVVARYHAFVPVIVAV